MTEFSLSQEFLTQAAAKHFVFLTYHAHAASEKEDKVYFASCFVIAMEGLWFLMTAGHVIADIADKTAKGVKYSTFRLQDKLAGNEYPFGIPYDFDLREWIVMHADDHGTDYAVAPITELVARNLDAGGIRPLRENGWGHAPFEQYPDWLLVGMPSESYEQRGSRHILKLTIIPIRSTECPTDLLNPPVNKLCARLIEQPDRDAAKVHSVVGMSGGPIFGAKKDERTNSVEYWAIGVQSSWLATHRLVFFCPLPDFLAGLKKAIREFRKSPNGPHITSH